MNMELRTPNLKDFLLKHQNAIRDVASSTITPEKMVRLVCAAASRQPDLALCTPLSILNAMMSAATYDLGVCDGSNEGYLVPYNVKTKVDGREVWQKQAQFIPGYQGLVKKAIESGKVRNIEARVVHAKDTFEYELGLTPKLKHIPHLGADRGEIIAAYAVGFMPDGSTQFEVMSRDEIDAIKNRGKEKKFSPWESDYSEMARKTVVRRLYKYLPKSKAMAALLEIQAKSEIGEFFEGTTIRPGEDDLRHESAKVLTDDGTSAANWTDESLAEVRACFGVYMDKLLDAGVGDEEMDSFSAKYEPMIGDPDVSPETWQNRALGGFERRMVKAA